MFNPSVEIDRCRMEISLSFKKESSFDRRRKINISECAPWFFTIPYLFKGLSKTFPWTPPSWAVFSEISLKPHWWYGDRQAVVALWTGSSFLEAAGSHIKGSGQPEIAAAVWKGLWWRCDVWGRTWASPDAAEATSAHSSCEVTWKTSQGMPGN